MNIIYKDFSDLGEYFESVNKPQDFATFRPGSVMDRLQSWWESSDKKSLPEMIPGGQEIAAVEVARTGETPIPGLVKKVSDAIGKEAADARLNNMVDARMGAWKAQDLKAFQDDPKSVANPFKYTAPGSDPITVRAARNADPQVYTSPGTAGMPDAVNPIPEEQLASTPGLLDKVKGVVNSITDLNGDGVTSGLEYGAIGAALAGAAGLGAKAFHNHRKNKKMKEAVQAYAMRYPNSKLAKAAGFSEGNLVITDRANKVFGKAKTNLLAHEAYFPSRRAQKLKWDVERQATLDEKIANAKGQEKEDLIAAANEIDKMNRKGNNYFTSLWYGEPGAMYHTPKKSVDALNKLLGQEFSEKPSAGQKVAYYLLGAFPRKVTGSAKNAYWDSVKEIAKLPEDQREAIYKDIDSMHKKRMVSDWVTNVSSQVIPYNPAAVINNIYQGTTQPQRYKEIVSANIKSPDKNFSEIGSSLIPR